MHICQATIKPTWKPFRTAVKTLHSTKEATLQTRITRAVIQASFVPHFTVHRQMRRLVGSPYLANKCALNTSQVWKVPNNLFGWDPVTSLSSSVFWGPDVVCWCWWFAQHADLTHRVIVVVVCVGDQVRSRDCKQLKWSEPRMDEERTYAYWKWAKRAVEGEIAPLTRWRKKEVFLRSESSATIWALLTRTFAFLHQFIQIFIVKYTETGYPLV